MSTAAARKPPAQAGVESVETAGTLLRALVEMRGPARLADLARSTGMPSAKAHRYLVSLIRAGLAEQDVASSRYDLGPLARRAGVVALGRSDALRRAEPVLARIVAQTGETAGVAVWGAHGPTLVRVVQSRHEMATSVPVGHVCAATFSATGLAYCAFGAAEAVMPLARRELEQSRETERRGVPWSEAQLRDLVTGIRAAGVATIEGEGDGRLAAVAAPVFAAGSTDLRFVLVVFGRSGRLNIATGGPVAALMAREAALFGQDL